MDTMTAINPIHFTNLGQAAFFHQCLRYYAGLRDARPQPSHPQFAGMSPARAEQIEVYAAELTLLIQGAS
jgi:hypothetical protein